MSVSGNHKTAGCALKITLIALNGVAIVMLILKLAYGSVSNDDLVAVMVVVFLGNLAITYIRKRKKVSNDE